MGCHFHFQGIFPTQELNLNLLHSAHISCTAGRFFTTEPPGQFEHRCAVIFSSFSGMADEGWSLPFRDPRSCSLLCGQLVNLPLSNVPGARQTSRPIYLKLRLEVTDIWTFLAAQRLRILLPLQGPRVPFLLRKGSTCQGATKPMGNND